MSGELPVWRPGCLKVQRRVAPWAVPSPGCGDAQKAACVSAAACLGVRGQPVERQARPAPGVRLGGQQLWPDRCRSFVRDGSRWS